jgi:hypothetical protein
MVTKTAIQKLYKDSITLLDYTDRMRESADSHRRIRSVHQTLLQNIRKIALANNLSKIGRSIICITGLQGSGKTTLMKNFYQIDDSLMDIAMGRGEKLPVLITEYENCSEPTFYAFCVEKNGENYNEIPKKINAEEFKSFASVKDEDATVMYLEIRVPFKHTRTENVSFMLLPGYERKNDYWQSLIDFSVHCATSAVFVMTENNFSEDKNKELLKKAKEQFGDNLIYVFSSSEGYDDNKKNDLRKKCCEEQDLASNHSDQIIFTKASVNSEENEEWISELKTAIQNYGNSAQDSYASSLPYYKNLVESIRDILWEIESIIRDNESNEILTELRQSDWLEAFDKETDKRKKAYVKNLNKFFDEAAQISCKELEKKWVDYSSSVKGFGNAVKKKFFGTTIKDVTKTREKIEKSFESSKFFEGKLNGIQYAFAKAITKTLNDRKQDSVKFFFPEEEKRLSLGFKTRTPASEETDSKILEQKEKGKKYVSYIAALMKGDNEVELQNNVVDVLKKISDLSTYYFCQNNIIELVVKSNEILQDENLRTNLPKGITQQELTTGLENVEGFVTKAVETYEKLFDDISSLRKKMSSSKKTELAGAAILAADFIPDQTFNLIPSLAASLGLTVPQVGVIVAGIFAAKVIVSLIQDINKQNLTEFFEGQHLIQEIYDKEKTKLIESFDDYIQEIRDKLEVSLIKIYGDNKGAIARFNAQRVLSLIHDEVDSLLTDIENEHDVYKDLTQRKR